MNLNVLKKVARELNEIDCTWALGSSVMLYFHNLIEKPNDIDILVDPEDTDKIKKVMNEIGEFKYLSSKTPFITKEFFSYNVDGVEIEFLGDFSIDLGKGKEYHFILDDKAIVESITIDDVKIKLTSLEDWLVAYEIMKDPKNRVPLIKKFLNRNGINNEELLIRNLEMNYSKNINKLITEIIN